MFCGWLTAGTRMMTNDNSSVLSILVNYTADDGANDGFEMTRSTPAICDNGVKPTNWDRRMDQ